MSLSIPKPLKILLNITLVFVVMVGFVLLVLGNIGGSSDALKASIEQYITDATGYQAQIGHLNNLSFFPMINIDFEELELRPPNNENALATVQKINVRIGFWDVIGSTGKVKNIAVENLYINGGIVTREPLIIDTIGITDPQTEGQTPALVLTGMLGAQPLNASATIAAYGQGPDRTYDLGQERKVDVTAGEIALKGFIESPSIAGITIKDISLTKAGQNILSGTLTFKPQLSGQKITGDITVGKGSKLQPDLSIASGVMNGTIKSEILQTEDVTAVAGAFGALSNLMAQKQKQAQDSFGLKGQTVDVTIDAPQIIHEGKPLGGQKIALTLKDGVLKAAAKDGTIWQGKTDWNAIIEPADGASQRLTVSAEITGLPMQSLTDKDYINSNIDAVIALQAVSSTWDGFVPALQGRITAATGEGQIKSDFLTGWGGGLGILLIPDFNPQADMAMKCALTDATLSNGIMKTDTIYVNASRIKALGHGTYDVNHNSLDLKIVPQPLDTGLGEVKTAVLITGSANKPSVRADLRDLGEKGAAKLIEKINNKKLNKLWSAFQQPQEQTQDATQLSQAAAAVPDFCQLIEGASGNKAAALIKGLQNASKEAPTQETPAPTQQPEPQAEPIIAPAPVAVVPAPEAEPAPEAKPEPETVLPTPEPTLPASELTPPAAEPTSVPDIIAPEVSVEEPVPQPEITTEPAPAELIPEAPASPEETPAPSPEVAVPEEALPEADTTTP